MTDEVRLHSKFIGELLNPRGPHEQKDKYYKLFINQQKINNLDSVWSEMHKFYKALENKQIHKLHKNSQQHWVRNFRI